MPGDFDVFDLGEDFLAKSITDSVLDQIIRRLIIWNFGLQDTWGSFERKELTPEVKKLLAKTIGIAADKGIMDMGHLDDLRHARELIGAPEISDADFAKMQAEKQAKAEAMQKQLAQPGAQEQTQKDKKGQVNPDEGQRQQYSFSRVNGMESWFAEV